MASAHVGAMATTEERLEALEHSLNVMFVLYSAFFVFIMQAGFAMVRSHGAARRPGPGIARGRAASSWGAAAPIAALRHRARPGRSGRWVIWERLCAHGCGRQRRLGGQLQLGSSRAQFFGLEQR